MKLLKFSQPFSCSLEPAKMLCQQTLEQLQLTNDPLQAMIDSLSLADQFLDQFYIPILSNLQSYCLSDKLDTLLPLCEEFWSRQSSENQPKCPEFVLLLIAYGVFAPQEMHRFLSRDFSFYCQDYRHTVLDNHGRRERQYQISQRSNFDLPNSNPLFMARDQHVDALALSGPQRARAFVRLWKQVVQNGLIIQGKSILEKIPALGDKPLPLVEPFFTQHPQLTAWNLGQMIAKVCWYQQSGTLSSSESFLVELHSVNDIVRYYAEVCQAMDVMKEDLHA